MVRDEEVYKLVSAAVQSGLKVVRDRESEGKYIGRYSDFPEMGKFESGLPHITKSSLFSDKSPKKYSSVFAGDVHSLDIPNWKPFFDLVQVHPALQQYYRLEDRWKDIDFDSIEGGAEFVARTQYVSMELTIHHLIDRYIHINKTNQFEEPKFKLIYSEWENAVFSELLQF